jgi:hypothetical protein
MSVGCIKVEMEVYLECDVDEAEAQEFVDLLPNHLIDNPIEGVDIQFVEIKNNS